VGLKQVLAPVGVHLTKLFMSRHGESEYNELSKLGGNSNLSCCGEEYAGRLCEYYQHKLEEVWSCPHID
jgi:broad specificity phosphatase PhoE